MKGILFILAIIVLIQLVQKLTGHSPIYEQVILAFLFLFIAHYFTVNRNNMKELRSDVRKNREDIIRIKTLLESKL